MSDSPGSDAATGADVAEHLSDGVLCDRLRAENRLMMAFLLARGRPLPTAAAARLFSEPATDADGPAPLTGELLAHAALSAAVRPATPSSLRYLVSHNPRLTPSSGFAVPLIRWLMVLAAVVIALFVTSATSSAVTETSGDIFVSSGWAAAINELFLLSAAAIGGTFAALFTAISHVIDFSFEPRYTPTYWGRLLLSLIAGLVISEIVPFGAGGDSSAVTKPLLAVLGGFSADFVYSILKKLIETLSRLLEIDVNPPTRSSVPRAAVAEHHADGRPVGATAPPHSGGP